MLFFNEDCHVGAMLLADATASAFILIDNYWCEDASRRDFLTHI
jgi:hypothetical protein